MTRRSHHRKRAISDPLELIQGVSMRYDPESQKLLDVPRELVGVIGSDRIGSIVDTHGIDHDLIPECPSSPLAVISPPLSVEHVIHVAFDSETNHFTGLPKKWEKILNGKKKRKNSSPAVFKAAPDPRQFLTNIVPLSTGENTAVFRALMGETPVVLKEVDVSGCYKCYGADELAVMREVRSKYLVSLVTSHSTPDRLSLVMEYMNGGSLSDVAVNFRCKEAHIAYFVKKILKGVRDMHKDGKIHRDLKCGNVFLKSDGSVKIGDFGFACDVRNAEQQRNQCEVVGTPLWMAPEVIHSGSYGFASDIWAVGVICRELADGEPPYARLPQRKVMDMIREKGMPPMDTRKWSPLFCDFVGKCNNVCPADRPPVKELLEHEFIQKACQKENILPVLESVKKTVTSDIFAMVL